MGGTEMRHPTLLPVHHTLEREAAGATSTCRFFVSRLSQQGRTEGACRSIDYTSPHRNMNYAALFPSFLPCHSYYSE
ncbi:MAG: hypothetical protein K2L77_08695 [Muribaculaceae bacterium]|nr:hypothetical protein [Muribaculaceae bacterium]